MVYECPNCHKVVDHTVTKLLSRCTNCNKDNFNSEQIRAIGEWREFGKQLENKG